jgi:TRAP-type C4-dicarboxylate transport system substrate-binding protein
MKKLFQVLLVVTIISILVFSGCTGQSPAPAPKPEPTTPAPAPAPAQPGSIELKFAYWPPPKAEICGLGFEPWGREIEDATGGVVKVKYFGGSAMGAPKDHYKLVESGTADIGVFVAEFTPGVFPLSSIANMPLIFPSSEIAAGALWQFHKKYTFDTELKNVKILAVSPTAPAQLLTKTKQVKTLDDFKGMKVSVTSPLRAKMVEALGAAPVFTPEGEVYTNLERGLVDGRLHEWDGAVVWKEMEVTKYRTGNINLSLNQMLVAMNLDTWNSLPANIQEIITGATGLHMSRHLGMIFDRANNRNLLVLQEYDRKAGNPEIYWLPEDERAKWIAAITPYMDAWVKDMEDKGLPGNAALKDVNGWVDQYKELWQ